MITPEQSREIRRLASVWATARVRKVMVHSGHGSIRETPEGVSKAVDQAEVNFENYLNNITRPA